MTNPVPDSIRDSFVFLESGQYSDFTIRCRGHEWKVHRAILCGQSGFFRRLCENGFKETTECAVDLVDDEPEIVAQMLIYIYSPKYYATAVDRERETYVYEENCRRLTVLLGQSYDEVDRMIFYLSIHAKVHGMSKKYDIPDLTRQTCELFSGYVRMLDEYDPLLEEFRKTSECVIDAAKVIYGSTQQSDRSLKEAIVYITLRFFKSLGQHGEKQDPRPLLMAIRSMDEFGWDLLSLDFTQAKFICNQCEETFTIDAYPDGKPRCNCAGRGIWGVCSPVDKLECHVCGIPGGCEVLWRHDEVLEEIKKETHQEVTKIG